MIATSCIYEGTVSHKRLRPKVHALSYRVFCLYLDVDAITEVAKRSWLFSYNRFNAVSFYDRDHGAGDGKTTAAHARATFAAAGLTHACTQIRLLCYPRIFGYGFNPISVYYGFDGEGQLAGVIYEVNNTFGQRRSYVAPISPQSAGSVHYHSCAKALYVSPFNGMDVRYSFRLTHPGTQAVLGVALKNDGGALLRTHFRGACRQLCDRQLARLLVVQPFLTLKVTVAIHVEALKIWLKGVPLTTKPPSPPYGVTHVQLTQPTPPTITSLGLTP
jgi:uncharacterized protein